MVEAAFEAWKTACATQENLEESSQKLYLALYNFATSIIINNFRERNPELALDIVAKAFLKCSQFRSESNFGTWFYKLAYNESLNWLKSQRRKSEVDLLDVHTTRHRVDPDRLVALSQLRGHLTREENAFLDSRLEGHTYEELSAIYGLTVMAARVRWKHILKTLTTLAKPGEKPSPKSHIRKEAQAECLPSPIPLDAQANALELQPIVTSSEPIPSLPSSTRKAKSSR